MSIFKRFSNILEKPAITDSDHSVIIQFDYPYDELDELFALDQRLDDAITASQAGVYDGHELQIGGTDARLYMYGPNAETLFKAVQPILKQTDYMKGAVAYLRFGGSLQQNAKTIEVELQAGC